MDSSEGEENPPVLPTTKKRRKYGRVKEVSKMLKLQSFETGKDCKCLKKCFDEVGEHKKTIIKRMNMFGSHDAINSYLAGQITILPIDRRRPRKEDDVAKFRDVNFAYSIRLVDNIKGAVELRVCKSAFIDLHGIGRGKLDGILNSLKETGIAPTDKRGKHGNVKHALTPETKEIVRNHIKSLKTRDSHYSLKDTSKKYLPADLNVNKLYTLFKQLNPSVSLSYESYRHIFCTDFNIAFGYPRKDTCSQCDLLTAKKSCLESELVGITDETKKQELESKIKDIMADKDIHLLQAGEWYKLKKKSKLAAQKNKKVEAIVFDYAKNYPVPNITTNDVYYKRQLSVYLFNIHVLSTGQSVYYVYPEHVGNKGSDEVCSFLHHFLYNVLDPEVTDLEAYCDSCSGQNKNNYVFKFFHHVVTKEHKLNSVKCSFPVRGHSFNECDKNSALIPQKTEAELPEDWSEALRHCRNKPSPFEVVEVDQGLIKEWTTYLDTMYRKLLGCQTRPIKIFKVEATHPAVMSYKTKYGGPWRENPMKKSNPKAQKVNKKKKGKPNNSPLQSRPEALQEGTFTLPKNRAYGGE